MSSKKKFSKISPANYLLKSKSGWYRKSPDGAANGLNQFDIDDLGRPKEHNTASSYRLAANWLQKSKKFGKLVNFRRFWAIFRT